MARIPTYTSQVSPSVGAGLQLPRANPEAFGAGFGEQLGRLGQQVEQRNENAELTDAALKFETFNSEFAEVRRLARENAAADGEGYTEAVLGEFDRRVQALTGQVSGRRAQQWLQLQVARLRGDVQVQEGGFGAGLRAAKVATDYQTSRDQAANALFTMPARKSLDETIAAHEALVDQLALPADIKAKLKTENRRTFGEQYARGKREADPYGLRAELDAGDLNALLTPDQLATIRNSVDAEIRGREAQARMEANQLRAERRAAEAEARREARDQQRAIADQLRDYNDYLRNGGKADPREISAMAAAAARTGNPVLARSITLLGARAEVETGLRGATPRQAQDLVNRLQGELAKAGDNAPIIRERLEAAEDFLRVQRSQLAADPLSYATSQNVVSLAPLDPADRGSVQARLSAAQRVRARYGGRLTVLTDEEVAEYRTRLYNGDPNARLQALMELRSFGGEGAAAAMRQIGRDNPVLARAGALLGTAGGATTARTILVGGEAIKQKRPATTVRTLEEQRAAARDVMGRTLKFLPELAAAVPDTSRAYYAGWAEQVGEDGWDSTNFERSVNAVLGGVRGQDGVMRGGLGERRGHKVLLPDGKTEAEFNAAMDRLTVPTMPKTPRPVWANGRPVNEQQLRGARPFAIGNGRYVLAADAAGDQLIMRSDGRPYVVEIR